MSQFTGRCHCGKNEFSAQAAPQFQFICYCDDCKSLNSSGHLCGMLFEESDVQQAQHTQCYSYAGGSGDSIELHFCSDCGTHLYAKPLHYPNKLVIRANTLTEGEFNPQQILFSESAFPWDAPLALDESTR